MQLGIDENSCLLPCLIKASTAIFSVACQIYQQKVTFLTLGGTFPLGVPLF